MVWLVALGIATSTDVSVRAQSISDKTYAAMETRFWDPQRKLYVEKDDLKSHAVFNWGAGVLLSALNARQDKKRIEAWWPVLNSYWNERPPVAGYDVLPNPGGVDRYYDDNAWMVIALLESGKQDWALKALDHALSGWDDKLGGGIYWRESDKASKNACSNSPVAVACFLAFEATKEERYKKRGLDIVDWTLKNLLDPEDKLIWDNVNLAGKIEKTKWSYNAALTIRALAFAERYGHKTPVSAKTMWEAAWKRWKTTDGIACEGKFAHLLVEVGLEEGFLTEGDREHVVATLERLGEPSGWLYGHRWDRARRQNEEPTSIDSASVVRVAALLARESKRR